MAKKIFILLVIMSASCFGMTRLVHVERGSEPKPTAIMSPIATATDAAIVCNVLTGIDTGRVNLRTCAGVMCPVLLVLNEGQALTVIHSGAWNEVTTANGVTGFINSNYCKNGE